jgi:short-subunit dehydrogenase
MKQVLITGASSGIGRELALVLAERGHGLILSARRDHLLREVREEALKLGSPHVEIIAGDIGSVAKNPKVNEYLKAGGEPVLVNNAGRAAAGAFHEVRFLDWRVDLETNLIGPMELTHRCVGVMLAAGSGLIVNVGSIAGDRAFAGMATYGATKAGLLHFGKIFREEVRRQGVRVTNVILGATDTPIWTDPESGPPREDMLTARAVAESIAWAIELPADRAVEEYTIMPPFGIL